ncbi:hypothetical protein B0H14DRAFT_2336983, partial [Mycena olivaceomarginata]
EYSQSYTHGGLWPVKLGDSFGPGGTRRYRIIFKLGYGSFSTVWLARDRQLDLIGHGRNVALKIVAAESTAQTQEADILERLRARNPTAGQQPNVIQLLDSFEHTSANGIHQVLLTETVLPLLTDFNNGYSKQDMPSLRSGSLHSRATLLLGVVLSISAFNFTFATKMLIESKRTGQYYGS